MTPKRPPRRLVLIVVDTLRRDHLSPYGASVSTPHVQALADRGQVFTNVLASFHQTTMSMGALFSGRTPSIESTSLESPLAWNGRAWCGLARFAPDDPSATCVPPGVPTLARILSDAGYWTIGIASNQLMFEPFGYAAGFYDWVEVGRPTGLPRDDDSDAYSQVRWSQVNRAAIAAVSRRPSDEFFLYVHYMDVHDYFHSQEPYGQAVERVDQAIGQLLGALEQRGLLEDAVVILTSDHGERLQEVRPARGTARHFGNPSFQELLRIPLVIAPPVSSDPQRFLRSEDLFHLILDLAGVASRASPDLEPDELFISELHFRTYLRGRWKSIQHRSRPRLHLFDLEEDPQELHDLAAIHPEIVDRHLRRTEEIATRLAARHSRRELGDMERQRLEALGYLDAQAPVDER